MTTRPEIVGYLDERDLDVMPRDLAEHLQGEKGFPFKTPLIRLADYEALAARLTVTTELLEAVEAVIAISDRKHDAWDAAKAAIAKVRDGL